jgi:uncharacterized protein YjbI with pentapeptide repeats
VAGPLRALRLQQARDAARGRLLTFGAGVFAGVALIYTARNFTLARRQLDLSQQTLITTDHRQREAFELAARGQVTERYTKAIEQLGSERLDVRIGGIYALERITRDYPLDYHPVVMEVLAAFVREHSRERWPLPQGRHPTVMAVLAAFARGHSREKRPLPGPPANPSADATRPDVHAAITVIGRRDSKHDQEPINLTGAHLDGLYLPGANLRVVDFAGAHLGWAMLRKADLSGARLEGAHLPGTDLMGAHLDGNNLSEAHLSGSNLGWAELKNAVLCGTDLTGAELPAARLEGAHLTGATLRDANLSGAHLDGAQFDGTYVTTAGRRMQTDLTDTYLTGAHLTGASWPGEAPFPDGWAKDPASGTLTPASKTPENTTPAVR